LVFGIPILWTIGIILIVADAVFSFLAPPAAPSGAAEPGTEVPVEGHRLAFAGQHVERGDIDDDTRARSRRTRSIRSRWNRSS
jgi:hypothetical protein